MLLEGLIELRPKSPAQAIWTAIAKSRLPPAMTAWHCVLEFYSVATRLPEEFRVSPADCLRLVDEELLRRLDVRDLPARSRLSLLRSAAAEGVAGGRIHDAHIGEIARLAGAGIVVTQNRRHFTFLLRHGVRVVTAEEYAGESGVAR